MGANTFVVQAQGTSAKDAFKAAVEEAQYEHGHDAYSGTIGTKRKFVEVSDKALPLEEASRLANGLIEKRDSRIDDKWGPCGCIPLEGGGFLFFGWAPS